MCFKPNLFSQTKDHSLKQQKKFLGHFALSPSVSSVICMTPKLNDLPETWSYPRPRFIPRSTLEIGIKFDMGCH